VTLDLYIGASLFGSRKTERKEKGREGGGGSPFLDPNFFDAIEREEKKKKRWPLSSLVLTRSIIYRTEFEK